MFFCDINHLKKNKIFKKWRNFTLEDLSNGIGIGRPSNLKKKSVVSVVFLKNAWSKFSDIGITSVVQLLSYL